jgi:hypothetical protein
MKGPGLKDVLIGAAGVVIGLVVSGLGPRAEVRALTVQLDACEAKPCSPEDLGSDLARMFSRQPFLAPETASAPSQDLDPTSSEDRSKRPGPLRAALQRRRDARTGMGSDGETTGDDASFGPESREAMQDVMELRRIQTRAALIEDADPDDQQLAAIDEAVGDMNDELYGIAEELAERVQAEAQPSRREAMEFAADTLDVLLTAEDRIVDSLDDDQLGALDEGAHDPFSWVDPGLLDVFAELGR